VEVSNGHLTNNEWAYIYIYIIEGSLEVKRQYGQMKSRDGKRQREEKSRREQIREEKESEERRCRCAKR
jgi:hypothetical protein